MTVLDDEFKQNKLFALTRIIAVLNILKTNNIIDQDKQQLSLLEQKIKLMVN